MKLFYIAFLIILWLNIFLGNEVIHTLTVLITTLYIVNRRKRVKNDTVEWNYQRYSVFVWVWIRLQNIKWHLESIRNAKSFSVLGPRPNSHIIVSWLFVSFCVGAPPIIEKCLLHGHFCLVNVCLYNIVEPKSWLRLRLYS